MNLSGVTGLLQSPWQRRRTGPFKQKPDRLEAMFLRIVKRKGSSRKGDRRALAWEKKAGDLLYQEKKRPRRIDWAKHGEYRGMPDRLSTELTSFMAYAERVRSVRRKSLARGRKTQRSFQMDGRKSQVRMWHSKGIHKDTNAVNKTFISSYLPTQQNQDATVAKLLQFSSLIWFNMKSGCASLWLHKVNIEFLFYLWC